MNPWKERFAWFWYNDEEIFRFSDEDFDKKAAEFAHNGVTTVITFSVTHFRWDYEPWWDHLLEILKKIVAACHKYGIKVVIEPLNSKETNFINTVPEGYSVCKASDKTNCFVLCDYFHFTEENEPFSDIERSKDRLAHVHIAHPGDRNVPLPEDGHDYTPFFNELKDAGYNSFISIEARKCDRETLMRSISHLEKYAQ